MHIWPAPAFNRRRCIAALAATGGGLWGVPLARAATVVRVIVPQPAGGAVDNLTRLLVPRMDESAVVENIPGAGGVQAVRQAAQAEPDGRTLMMAYSGLFGVAPTVAGDARVHDPVDVLAVAAVLVSLPSVLVVRADFPARDLGGLIAMAGAGQPLSYATPGIGTSPHLAAELLKDMARIELLHVPYRGGTRAIIDLLGGQVSMALLGLGSAAVAVREGKLRVLGVTSSTPLETLPQVPTFAQQGLNGFDVEHWFGVFAPVRTPEAVLQEVNARWRAALRGPDVRPRIIEQGMRTLDLDLAASRAYVAHEVRVLRAQVRKLGLSQMAQ